MDQYIGRISGPLLDRIDLQIEMPAVSALDLTQPNKPEASASVRERVIAARERQRSRCTALNLDSIRTNAEFPASKLAEIAVPDEAGRRLLQKATQKLGLTARGYHRTLRLARTVADLDQSDTVTHIHVKEALVYRGETLKGRLAA